MNKFVIKNFPKRKPQCQITLLVNSTKCLRINLILQNLMSKIEKRTILPTILIPVWTKVQKLPAKHKQTKSSNIRRGLFTMTKWDTSQECKLGLTKSAKFSLSYIILLGSRTKTGSQTDAEKSFNQIQHAFMWKRLT